jgi:hypothetical protein
LVFQLFPTVSGLSFSAARIPYFQHLAAFFGLIWPLAEKSLFFGSLVASSAFPGLV